MNEKFVERIAHAAIMTWDAIGADCLVNEDGEPDESVIMSREEVIEMVVDADRIKMYGDLDKLDYDAFLKLSRKDRDKIMKKAFPFPVYGW